MKVKIFSSQISMSDIENKIADWTKDLNPKIISINIDIKIMNDYYQDSAPPMICNTWYEYLSVIVYE